MFGNFESVVALALLAFEPNIIAHGSLVTTDMALTTTMFAAVYALYRHRRHPTVWRFLMVGLAVGLMLSAKHSGILVLPILFLLWLADIALFRKIENEPHLKNQLFRDAAAFAGVVIFGVILLWASYGFRYSALPNAAENGNHVGNFLANAPPEKNGSAFVQTVRAFDRAQIFPESYTLGLADVTTTNSRPMFLLGTVFPTGRWFYFPAAFSIKTSVALLVLLVSGLLMLNLYRSRGREMLFLLVPPLIFFAVSLTSELNIGVRHILPVYPFFILIAAAGACAWSRKYSSARYFLIALLIFHFITAWRTAPNYLAFANDFWGGTNNTYRLLDDSNVDWGQNFKLVGEYLARENITDCWIAAFGNGELARHYQPCRLMPGEWGWNFTEQPVEPVPTIIEGTILLSTAVLPARNHAEYLPFAASEPIAFIGGSIRVYRGRFEVPLVAALSHAGRAQQFILQNRFEEAIADGFKAIEQAPDDPRTHLVLGTALARAKRPDEARREYEATIRLAQSKPGQFGFEEMRAQNGLRRLQQ